MERKHFIAAAAILFAFSIGLVGFYLFASELGDGLEVTMEKNGVEEGEPVYQAPFDYGDSYLASLIMGLIGFAATFGLIFLYMRGSRSLKSDR